jgi:hypothetical protein
MAVTGAGPAPSPADADALLAPADHRGRAGGPTIAAPGPRR